VAPDRTRLLGAGALAAAAVVAALAVPPYRLWRSGRPLPWLRDLATAYWLVALVSLFFAEAALIREPFAATVAAWAATAALAASLAEPLAEERLWHAGVTAALGTTLVCLSAVTPPSRLVLSSAHPGAELWALAVCIVALAWLTRLTPDRLHGTTTTLGLLVLGLAVFALSLGVLESAERISSASVDTDFQRGHTAVSALWGTLALGVFVAGLLRGRAAVQRLGLVLFGLALAKLFLYDLRSLSSITRALSFLAVGAILLTAAFFAERLVHRGGGPGRPVGPRPA
jgi:uncharacterized membrane protein